MTTEKPSTNLPLISWFDETAKASVKAVFDGINEGVESLDIFKKYRTPHFKSLRSQVQSVKILGMSTPVRLVEIFEPPMISTSIHRRLYEVEWMKADENGDTPLNRPKKTIRKKTSLQRADSFVEKNGRVVILGGPGSGKTTLLRFLAYAYLDKGTFKTTNLKTSKFPIFIRLPDLAQTGDSIEEFTVADLTSKTDQYAAAFLRRIFKNGYATLLLDSLDEVPSSKRERIESAIEKFCSKYPSCKVIVSCRTADYSSIGESFFEVELAHLTKAAIIRIIRGWFQGQKSKATRLISHINHDEDIAQLTETPLLLSLLCIQFHHDMTLPKRKAELYRRCIDALLRDWDASRGFRRDTAYENLSDDRKERLFEHIAGYFFTPVPRYTFPEKELVEEIGSYGEKIGIDKKESAGVLGEIESHHGLIEKISSESFAFSHPSIHEFFVGRCALSRRTDLALVKSHFEHEDWASVIEFVVALREDPEELIQHMMKKSSMSRIKTYPAMARRTQNLWLLYRCLATGAALSAKFKTEVLLHIIEQQIGMSRIYQGGGVIPYASLVSDGVRHSYYYYRMRSTLAKALEPLRKLGNTIYAAPSSLYSRLAIDRARQITSEMNTSTFSTLQLDILYDVSMILLLTVPVAPQLPEETKELLAELKAQITGTKANRLFENWIDESISNIK